MSGNLCRCGAYANIVAGDLRGGRHEAVQLRARRRRRRRRGLLAGRPEARFLAGGTNLVDLMKLGVETPDALVDVNALRPRPDRRSGRRRRCGSARRCATATSPPTRWSASATRCSAEALLAGASGPAAQLATAAETCCSAPGAVYFQDVTKPCNKRVPGGGCPAREGEHRNLAILGDSDALRRDAPLRHGGRAGGARRDACTCRAGPATRAHPARRAAPSCRATRPERDTVLEPGELITAVELPPLPARGRSATARRANGRRTPSRSCSVAAALDVARTAGRRRADRLGGVAHEAVARPPGRGGAARRRRPTRRAFARRRRRRARGRRSRCATTPSRCRWPAT